MFVFKYSVTVFKHACHRIINKRFVSSKVRVRFAPSPTGFLHLGGLRTALYNYLYAKSQNGVFILRIEDTDLSRKVPSATENLIEDLAWFGINFDEGPYFQSERKEIYQKYAQQLIEQGDAYYCFCSNTRLNLIRKEAVKTGEIPKYDNNCRHLTKEEVENNLKTKPACIRFKMNNFTPSFNDLILGSLNGVDSTLEGDFVILKTDGFPTYHLANVVDDHLMKITHVLRGIEWLSSITKHILLYRAFKWDHPTFGHLPLLMNEDGVKLSKRHGGFQVNYLREKGYFPNSVINFIARIGGGFSLRPEKNIQIYTLEELTERFDISKIHSNSSKLDMNLLPSYNHAELIRQFESTNEKPELLKKIRELVQKHFQNGDCKNGLLLDDKRIENTFKVLKHRILHLEDIVNENFRYLWFWENKWDNTNEAYNEILRSFADEIENVDWTSNEIKKFLKIFCEGFKDFKYADIMRKIRLALTGNEVGHGVIEIMSTLSKEDVKFRLSEVLKAKPRSNVSQ